MDLFEIIAIYMTTGVSYFIGRYSTIKKAAKIAREAAREEVEEAERTARLFINRYDDLLKGKTGGESVNHFKNRLCPITREEIPVGADIYYLPSAKGYVTKEVFDAYSK